MKEEDGDGNIDNVMEEEKDDKDDRDDDLANRRCEE